MKTKEEIYQWLVSHGRYMEATVSTKELSIEEQNLAWSVLQDNPNTFKGKIVGGHDTLHYRLSAKVEK